MKFASLFCGFPLAVLAFSENKIPLEALPPAVQIAVKEQTKDAKILGFATEREKGQVVYEAETKRNGKSRDLTFNRTGQLLEVDEEVSLGELPAQAWTALQEQAADGTIIKVESVTRGMQVAYEATIRTKRGKRTEIAVNSDGTSHKD